MQALTVPASVSKRKQACQSCRQRKRRCDSERPSCGLCRKWNIRCEYTVPASLPVEQTSSIPSYMKTPSHDATTYLEPFSTWNPTLPLQLSGFGLDALSTAQNDTITQHGFPTPASNLEPNPINVYNSESTLFPDASLPSDALIVELVELFFDKLYFMLPCLHKETFLEELRNGHMIAQSPLLIYSLLAVAAGFHHDPSIKARRSDWYEQAKFLYDFSGRHPESGLRTIQAVVFLVYHAYTCGDFSSCWLYIGKAWRQVAALGMNRLDSQHAVIMPVGLKDGAGNESRGYCRREWTGRIAIEKEECRRVLWLLFFMDRNQTWPTGWPNAIDERHFKIDIPVADCVFQAMSFQTASEEVHNVSYNRNINVLLKSVLAAKDPLNMFHYLIVAYILLGRTTELIHTIHDSPDSPEYAEQCAELDDYVAKLRLSMPRTASSVLEAPVEVRGQVVWLNATLNTIVLLLNYRAVPFSDPQSVKELFSKTLMAAKNTSQTIKDASRISIDLLLNMHIAPSLYVACCVLIIHQRLEDDASLTNDIDFLELVFERMNDVFSVIGLKFVIALKRDRERNREELLSLRERGYRGLLADCSKWGFVRDEVAKLGMTMT